MVKLLDVDRLGGVGLLVQSRQSGAGSVVRRPAGGGEADLELGRIPKGRGRRWKRGATWDNKNPLLSRLDPTQSPSSSSQAKLDCMETNIQIV